MALTGATIDSFIKSLPEPVNAATPETLGCLTERLNVVLPLADLPTALIALASILMLLMAAAVVWCYKL